MKPFTWLEPRTPQEAVELKRQNQSSIYIAGGTDVVPLMKYDLIDPAAVISLERVAGLSEISLTGDNLEIGGAVRLHQLQRYAADNPALSGLGRAAQLAASPQIRRLGTVAGNLRQCRRCYYYNQTGLWRRGMETCLKNGGPVCHQAPAKKICQAIHYSDLAPALLAAGASAEVLRGGTVEAAPLPSLWAGASPWDDDALVVKIVTPEISNLKRLFFRKRAARAAIDFPLANAALAWRNDGRVSLAVGAMSSAVFFLEDTAALISQRLRAGEPLADDLEETAVKEARGKMRPIKEATVSPAVKIKAMAAVVREVLGDLRRSFGESG